eukprot:155784-Prymnesium_polylepis.2
MPNPGLAYGGAKPPMHSACTGHGRHETLSSCRTKGGSARPRWMTEVMSCPSSGHRPTSCSRA